MENVKIIGNETSGLSMEGEIKNCIIANNLGGVSFRIDDARNKVINSTIVNNRGIGVTVWNNIIVADSKVELYNNIIMGNRDILGRWMNLHSMHATFTKVHNNYIEGGKDSSYISGDGIVGFAHPAKFGTYQNNFTQAPVFVKPSFTKHLL